MENRRMWKKPDIRFFILSDEKEYLMNLYCKCIDKDLYIYEEITNLICYLIKVIAYSLWLENNICLKNV